MALLASAGRLLRRVGERMESTGQQSKLWPSTDDVRRRNRYKRGWQLFDGQHMALFEPARDLRRHGPYVVANALRACSRAIADRMVLEPPKPTVGEADDVQEALDAILSRSQWGRMIQRAVKGWSYRGDLVMRAYWQADLMERTQPDGSTRMVKRPNSTGAVSIAEVLPSSFFPEYDDHSEPELMSACSLCWEWKAEEEEGRIGGYVQGELWWQREEYHTPGRIENRLYMMRKHHEAARWQREQVELSALPEFAGLPESAPTGIDVIPIVHAPNNETGEDLPWGESDYSGGAEESQRVINERATDHRHMLRKWGDPMIGVGLSYLNEQKHFNAYGNKALPMLPGEQPPQFISVPLENYPHSDTEADKALRRLLWHIGVSPESIGISEEGAAESGRAIRLRQHDTLSTVARKWTTLEPCLKQLFAIALQMNQALARGPQAPEAEEIDIEHSDGLVKDELEELQELNLEKALGFSDEHLIRKRYPEWNDEAVAAELARRKSQRPSFDVGMAGTRNAPPQMAERAQEQREEEREVDQEAERE